MKDRYWLIYLLLVAVQIVLGNFLNLGQLIVLCLLPLLVLSLPVKYTTPAVLLISFATGMMVDILTHGIPGLGTVALLPVAAGRLWIIRTVFGSELRARGEDLSVHKQGVPKIALAVLIATALYFAIFVWVDAAGTRSFGFCVLRWLLSTLASTLLEILLLWK